MNVRVNVNLISTIRTNFVVTTKELLLVRKLLISGFGAGHYLALFEINDAINFFSLETGIFVESENEVI